MTMLCKTTIKDSVRNCRFNITFVKFYTAYNSSSSFNISLVTEYFYINTKCTVNSFIMY